MGELNRMLELPAFVELPCEARLSFFPLSCPFFSIRTIASFPTSQLLFKYKECRQFKENPNKLKAQFLLTSSSFLSLRTSFRSRFLYLRGWEREESAPNITSLKHLRLGLLSGNKYCLVNATKTLRSR